MLLYMTSGLRSRTSINLETDLEAGVYEVRLRMTSKKHPQRPKVEDVIRIGWTDSRVKLLHICPS
jgi:seryl-tRNA(Sec) selenium transferase